MDETTSAAFGGNDRSAARWFATQPGWWDAHYVTAVDEITSFLEGDGVALSDVDVLDVGCGDGIISLGLADRTSPKSVVGLDLQPVDLAFLQAEAIANGRSAALPTNLDFRVSTPTRVRADDDSFDVAVTWSVFEHVADPVMLLREIRRVLRPNGVLFLQIWPFYASEHGSHLWPWFDDAFVQHRYSDREVHDHLHETLPSDLATAMVHLFRSCNQIEVDSLQRDVLAAGFKIVKFEILTNTVRIPDALDHLPLSQIGIAGVKLLAIPR